VETSGRIVARNFLALGSGEAIARLIAFAATIYMARVLGAQMYGVIGFATAVLLYLNRVADFGIELSGARDLARDPTRLQSLASSVLTVRLLFAVGLVAVTSLAGLLLLPHPDGVILSVYSLTLLAVGGGTRWIYLGLERARLVAIARTLGELTMAALVFALVHAPGDAVRAPWAQVAGDGLAALLLMLWLRRSGHALSLRLDWPAVRPLFRRAWPLVLSALLGLVIYNSGLIFLRVFQGSAAVGYFAAANTLISFLVNLGLSYRMSLLPTLSRLHDARSQQIDLYHAAMAHVFAIAFPIGLGGFLLAPQIIEVVFGNTYAAAVPALQWLIWSVPLCLLRDVPSAALLANAREDQFFRLTAWGAALNLLLNLLLIPRFGLVGAGMATVATEILRLVIALAYVRSHGFRLRGLTLFARVSLAAIGMTALLLLSRPAAIWIALPVGVLTYAASLVALGGVRVRRGERPALNL
jgi:O-antigen/teichoic acid export membrane protein